MPPKIKHFAWREVKEGLAVRGQLVKRGLDGDIRCALCGERSKSVLHALATFPEAKRVWYYSPVRLEIEDNRERTFKEWCVELRNTYKEYVTAGEINSMGMKSVQLKQSGKLLGKTFTK